jgi:dipeptidyl aminopeptidase/acylaminoacyl peptidase
MGKITRINRRTLMKWVSLSGGVSLLTKGGLFASSASQAQTAGTADSELYEGKNLPGGAQVDPRLMISPYSTDPDIVDAADRMSPFNPESWHVEWKRLAEKNERSAEEFEKEGLKVTANGFYLRAARFYQEAVIYLPESDSRMMPSFNKLLDMYKRAWQLVPPAFERVEIPYEGTTLPGFFSKPRGNPGQRFPAVYAFGGADPVVFSSRYSTESVAYNARGMAYLHVDGPGQGIPLRLKHVYAPPDSERVAKAVLDYLVTRPDVDPDRIGVSGASMGGYTAPRMASGENRIKAAVFFAGAFSLREDIFEYFPPIQERVRWLIGAKDLVDARRKIAEFTLEGRANQIECPMLIGYSKDDRIMDPQGAFRLHDAATRSKCEMLEGVGHDSGRILPAMRTRAPREILFADWMARHLVGATL